MKKGGNNKMAGLILRQTVEDYLMEHCRESEAKIVESNLCEIEKETGAISVLGAVIHKLCPTLAYREGIVPPKCLFETVVYSNTPNRDLKRFLRQMKRINGARRAELIIMMLNEAHDEWVKQHSDLFFDLSKQYLRCRFMPMELIGFDVARQYLIYVRRLLDLFGWAVDEKLLMIAYRFAQDRFYLRHELRSDEELVLFVAKAEYEALSPRIRKELLGNNALARRMVYS